MSAEDEAHEAAPEPPAPAPNPGAFRLRGDPPRVVRLSRKALIVLGSVSALSVGGALLYALGPQHAKPGTELYNTDSRNTADKIGAMPKDYGDVPRLGPPLPGDLGRPIVNAQNQGKVVPAPGMGGASAAAAQSPAETARQQARQRAVQVREAARESKLFTSTTPAQAATTIAETLPAGSGAPANNSGNAPTPDPNGQDTKRAFLAQAPDKRTTSSDRVVDPASPNILQAGSVIPAALVTGLRSDLPGQITAQVTQNVYDSPTGLILLIPQGAKLIGEYDSSVAFGQRRLLLAWTRLLLPDGRSIVLERQPGADAAGHAGLEDRVNNHWGQLFKAAVLSTLLSVGSEAGTSQSENNLAQALRAGASQSFSQTGQQVVERQLNIQPTLTIRPGFPVRVMVTHDLVLEPWQHQ
ncbi:TrbI/VirB10 family protein [Sphingomonas oligoaromativorans]|uniref:TrbI/VirB10 family protein n=1 Tax=Sphingomonas oligoaromativorans TaxID=575322 RepID=UPI00142260A8|nr:TrbI/VirB10 family protein [Sphingomonas oligoaromativorans]NIJ34106.1 type IV secretion system protein VirB10 [Sphingomonas oligoaromativorans]